MIGSLVSDGAAEVKPKKASCGASDRLQSTVTGSARLMAVADDRGMAG